MRFLPGEFTIGAGGPNAKLVVQPDAIFETPSTYTLAEAKRNGSFQPEQLAREYVALVSKAGSPFPSSSCWCYAAGSCQREWPN